MINFIICLIKGHIPKVKKYITYKNNKYIIQEKTKCVRCKKKL